MDGGVRLALTNAEKQRRWRERRNALAELATGYPENAADGVLHSLGAEEARMASARIRKALRLLDKRLRNLKADCPVCHGSGFTRAAFSTACGTPLGDGHVPCDCSG
jgi:glutathione S-transferase